MGTTIRRQPVRFDIPKAPDYKFLNITNFRGLDVSSNPFELSPNTASDCLNVYVDETNTLTTRPRLDKKIDTPIDGDHIATYNLHNGYLLHYNKNVRDKDTNEIIGKQVEMNLLQDGKLNPTPVSGNIPAEKCQYFEQGDKIYLLDGSQYLVLSTPDNALAVVEGYVPTTAVVTLTGEKKSVEPLNLLSENYIERYYWDGLSKKPTKSSAVISVDNKYYTEHNFDNKFVPLQCYDDYTAIGYYYGQTDLIYAEFDPDKEPKYTSLNTKKPNKPYFMTTEKGFWAYSDLTVTRYALDDGVLRSLSVTIDTIDSIGDFHISPDGTHAVATVTHSLSAWTSYYISVGSTSLTYKVLTLPTDVSVVVGMSNDYMFATKTSADNSTRTLYYARYASNPSFGEMGTIPNTSVGYFMITPDSSLIVMYSSRNYATDPITLATIENLDTSTFVSKTVILPLGDPQLSQDKIIYGGTYGTKTPAKTWYFPDYHDLEDYEILDIGDHYFDPDNYNWLNTTQYFTHFFKNKYIVIFNVYGDSVKSKYYVFNNSNEPLLEYKKIVREEDNGYSDWNTRREQFFKSKLHTRFDNNYWFASGNRYYRSANNDPTYFPITEYNDLGDSNEEITGFNLANDTTLIAYKKNRLYLIQPFTSSLDTTEYTITESKNTVGNTAIGAPIVTTLTEIPLQINNDGVYGLSQVSNVSATERIADLMSEPINERWLDIPDNFITNAKTLNRLYWTYIIISREDLTKTTVYLLDNRTNSWYYWEFPIMVTDAFVKDNVTEFVDIDGNIYRLTITDILDINYDDEQVTKYYDEGERLIPWFWQSQILTMGTMNYSKRLVNTTFILTDTDNKDGYGLTYSFKVFRKLASSTPEKEISDKLNLVRSTTKKTNISKFGFVQLRISNLTQESRDYEALENNKLRLVGLGLKYVLLEGLIR